MASLREISYDLFQLIQKNNVDDSDIDIRSVRFWIKNQRAIWVRNEIAKNHGTSHSFIQDLGSLALSTAGTEKRTTNTIPTPIHVRERPHIVRVGPTTITNDDYMLLPYESAKYHGNGKFNEGLIAAYYYNQYVYLKGDVSALTTVNIRGVFENPMDVSGMTVDSYYPVDEALIEYMKAEIIKADIKMFMAAPDDVINNASAQ